MLKKAEVHNFQNVKKAVFDFHPLTNIIAGESDNGKSTCYNNIIWNIRNKPSGYNFKPHNAKRGVTTVSDITYDNCSVRKEKSKSKHKYILNGEENKPFEAFGQNVPPQISDLINIPDYCIQTQFDKHFLLDDSPGEVAKKINDVCDLSIIHETSSKIDSIVSKAKRDLEYTKETLDEKNKELKNLDYVDDFEALTKSIEDKIGENEKLQEDINFIKETLDEINELQIDINKAKTIIKLYDAVDSLKGLIEESEEHTVTADRLEKAYNDIIELQGISFPIIDLEQDVNEAIIKIEANLDLAATLKYVDDLLDDINNLKKSDLSWYIDLEQDVEDLIQMIEDSFDVSDRREKIEDDVALLTKMMNNAEKIKQKRIELQSKYDEFYSSLEYCPTCGTNLNKEDLC